MDLSIFNFHKLLNLIIIIDMLGQCLIA